LRYLAADVYWFLEQAGCTYEGDRYPCGQAWLSPGSQVFFLPARIGLTPTSSTTT
jgi:hypothetical protein